jgi:membrane-bound inhibitor of C-type lysozyme
MIRHLAAPALLSLLLAACASTADRGPPPPASAPSGPSAGPVRPPVRPAPRPAPSAAPGVTSAALVYRCAGGKRFTAAWGLADDRVQVSAGGVTKSLPHLPSASGARYGDGVRQIWGKGDQAMLEGFPGGPYKDCRTD